MRDIIHALKPCNDTKEAAYVFAFPLEKLVRSQFDSFEVPRHFHHLAATLSIAASQPSTRLVNSAFDMIQEMLDDVLEETVGGRVGGAIRGIFGGD